MYSCSEREFEEFEKSNLWKDMVTELTVWLGEIRNNLEDPDGSLTDKQLHKLGGNAETIRNVFRLPETVRLNIKALNEAKEQPNEQPNEEG